MKSPGAIRNHECRWIAWRCWRANLHKEAMRDFEINSKIEGMGGKDAEKKAQALVGRARPNRHATWLTQAADAEGRHPAGLRVTRSRDASVEALGEILIENPWRYPGIPR